MKCKKPQVTLITGGGRSGKSRVGHEAALRFPRRVFIATAVSCDAEMADRIARHQQERGNAFRTVEEPVRLAEAIQQAASGTDVILVDCLTVWLSNLLYERQSNLQPQPQIDALLELLKNPPCELIFVTNEVGMGIIPDNALAREFRDLTGSVNQKVAALADNVIFMVSGLPIFMKGATPCCEA